MCAHSQTGPLPRLPANASRCTTTFAPWPSPESWCKVLAAGPEHYRPLRGHELFMPLEYPVAAFRFGHTMVRGGYDHNRNLLRGYLLSIPTGQAMAAEMGVPPLADGELERGNTPELDAALEEGGFLRRTPLWCYVLKEAEARADGDALGELGSRIVCETLGGLPEHDRDSFFHERGRSPADAVRLPNGDPVVTIRDSLGSAGVAN